MQTHTHTHKQKQSAYGAMFLRFVPPPFLAVSCEADCKGHPSKQVRPATLFAHLNTTTKVRRSIFTAFLLPWYRYVCAYESLVFVAGIGCQVA